MLHYNISGQIASRLRGNFPRSETDFTIDNIRLTVTFSRGSLDWLAVGFWLPESLHTPLAISATAQVSGADPPGGTQGYLSPRGGLIAFYWRVAPWPANRGNRVMPVSHVLAREI